MKDYDILGKMKKHTLTPPTYFRESGLIYTPGYEKINKTD